MKIDKAVDGSALKCSTQKETESQPQSQRRSNSSSKRGGVLIETEEDREKKKLRAVLEMMMGLQKKQPKALTWDTIVKKEGPEKNNLSNYRFRT